tara:strand:+ start:48 stop:1019 length:972 start_codon:yes stop_codon:yes gene_type:complete
MVYQVFIFKNDQICYELESFNSISINKQTPVSPMPLPEEDSEENVLMKIEGNTTTMSLNWTLTNASTSIAECSFDDLEYSFATQRYMKDNIQTDQSGVFDQVSYIEKNLAPNSLNDFFVLYILDSEKYYLNALKNKGKAKIYEKMGLIQDFQFNTDSSSPVNWQATMSFIEGAVVTSMSENLHQPPTITTPPKFTVTGSGSTLQRTGITVTFKEFQNYSSDDRPITTGLTLRYKKEIGANSVFWTEKTLAFSANTTAPYNYTKTIVIGDLESPNDATWNTAHTVQSTPYGYSGKYKIQLAVNTIGGRGEWLKDDGTNTLVTDP